MDTDYTVYIHAQNDGKTAEQIKYQTISLIAYYKAMRRGFEPGHELDDWIEAENEYAMNTW